VDFTDNPPSIDYQGTGNFAFNANSFTEASYPDWFPGTPTAPLNTWWKNEKFDISGVCANQANVQIRFVLTDVILGLNGRYGWLLDNICVKGAPCELIPPTASAPATGSPLWQGTIFNLGPFPLDVYINDPSGIQSAILGPGFADLYYTVNGGAVQQDFLFQIVDSLFSGQLPAANDGDTICWWFEAYDASGCNNYVRFPATGEICFYPVSGITFPFCDNFEIQNDLWTADDSTGTGWLRGTPTGSGLNSAHSPTNVWGVGEVNSTPVYSQNTISYLLSPVFDFSTVSVANLSFWQNRNVEASWDGVRLEFSNNGGSSWTTVGSGNTANPDPNGLNWYTDDAINSSNTFAWDGNSNGWIESRYKLGTVPGLSGSTSVQFRYVFTSDASVQNAGFHLDDFCITIPCNDDVGVTSFVSPPAGSGQPAGSTSQITVGLENFGQLGQSNFPIQWSINGVTQTPITYPGTLAAGATGQATLPSFVVPSNSYSVCVWSELPNDCFGLNDTVCTSFVGIPTLTPAPFYCDDFESGNIGWSAQLGPNGDPGTVWELGTPAFASTSTAFSGNNAWDINLSSVYTNNANAELYTPYFDFSSIGSARLSFMMNYYAENNWDGTRLEYTVNGGTNWIVLGTGSTNPGNQDPCGSNWYNDDILLSSQLPGWTGLANSGTGWLNSTYKLCCTNGIFFNPTPVQFRFVFTSDPSVLRDGVSIDDFCIYAATGDDVGISAITSPVGGVPVGVAQPVIVTLENYGATTITSVPVSYSVNGGAPTTITWTGSLPPCGQVSVVLPNYTFAQGPNTICSWTSLATDQILANDTSCADVIGQPIITPTYVNSYDDNFDSGNIGWAPGVSPGGTNTTIWEFGTPNFGGTSGAYSAPNCWDVNLNTGVTGGANTYVTTPFFDFANAQAATLKFWQNRVMNAFGDKLYLEYSVNGGPWTLLTPTTQTVTNWYNNNDSWDDNTGLWIQSIFKDVYSAVGNGIVQFRFVYTSVNFTNSDGASIDNFEVFVPIPLSVTTLSVNTSVPNQFIFPGQPITFAAPIKNNGVNTVFNHNATLTIDGGIVSSDPLVYVPSGLAPDSSETHNFNNTWIAVPGFHEVCVYTDSPNGSTDLYTPDDTACVTVLVFDSVATNQLPYCTSFESGSQWVTANAISYRNQSSWEIGTPAKPTLNGARNGNNAWTTKLTGTYPEKDSSGLFSSLFRVQPGHCYKISFHHRFLMEYGSDGGAVDYSVDYGQNWERIDFLGTPNIVLYGSSPNYTYVSELDPNNPGLKGFTGSRTAWTYHEKIIRPDADAQLIVRWRFASDYSANDEGWSIDDVCFEDLGPCAVIGLDDFAVNNLGISQNYPNPADGQTNLEYMIPAQGMVRIVLTDLIGQVVSILADGSMAAGKHTVQVNTSTLAPGMYQYTFMYEGQQITKRMIVAH